jgi:hypothetical protein
MQFARSFPLICLSLSAVLGAGPALAQETVTGFTTPTVVDALAAQKTPLTMSAKLTEDSDDVPSGITWRVFSSIEADNGKLPMVANFEGGRATFSLTPGSYLVHAAFGRAGITKRITLGLEPREETIFLDAGGIKLNASLPSGVRIPKAKLRFSIYDIDEDLNGNRQLIIGDVTPDSIVRLNAGSYHVVSTYGAVNAVIRADIRVEAGKLTDATVEHRAAQTSFKLVRETGGEAIADTSWSILTDQGDLVRESVAAFTTMVLAEGDYTVIAKNRDRIFQKDFTVEAGKPIDVEVLAVE